MIQLTPASSSNSDHILVNLGQEQFTLNDLNGQPLGLGESPEKTSEHLLAVAQRIGMHIGLRSGACLADTPASSKGASPTRSGVVPVVETMSAVASPTIKSALGAFDFSGLGQEGSILEALLKEQCKKQFNNQLLPTVILPSALDYESLKLTESIDIQTDGLKSQGRRLNSVGAFAFALESMTSPSKGHGWAKFMDMASQDALLAHAIKHRVLDGERQRDFIELVSNASAMPCQEEYISALKDISSAYKAHFNRATQASIYWSNKKVGSVSVSGDDTQIHFDDPSLQSILSNRSVESTSSVQSFIAQLLPGTTGDSQSIVEQTIKNGLHGIGNVSIVMNGNPIKSPDVKGPSISEFATSNKVFPYAAYNVIRPSSFEANLKSRQAPFEHQQYKIDRDEVAISGQQPKTMVHIISEDGEVALKQSTLKDPATHILKFPKNAVDKDSTLCGREWLSMSIAESMGVDIPNFALVDMNKTGKQYVASYEQGESDAINALASENSFNLFGSDTLGEALFGEQVTITDTPANHSDIIEPPGIVIERFDLSDPGDASQQKMGVDFCALLGLSSNQRHDTTIEALADMLREHSTNFEADKEQFLKRTMSSWMLGDGDMHAKNVSMLITKDSDGLSCRLSPAYDIVSAAGLSGYAVKMALPVNGTREPTLDDFVTFAMTKLDIAPAVTLAMAQEMATAAYDRTEAFRSSFSQDEEGLPLAIKRHTPTNRGVVNAIDGIQMALYKRDLLDGDTAAAVKGRIENENPEVFKESEMLFGISDEDIIKELSGARQM